MFCPRYEKNSVSSYRDMRIFREVTWLRFQSSISWETRFETRHRERYWYIWVCGVPTWYPISPHLKLAIRLLKSYFNVFSPCIYIIFCFIGPIKFVYIEIGSYIHFRVVLLWGIKSNILCILGNISYMNKFCWDQNHIVVYWPRGFK
jgi:hypothetical protein